MARRSPWIDEKARLLVRLLDERHGLQIDEDCARDDISDHVDLVSERMRIGRQAAKVHVTDEVIEDLAARVGRTVNRHLTKQVLDSTQTSHLRVVRSWERDVDLPD